MEGLADEVTFEKRAEEAVELSGGRMFQLQGVRKCPGSQLSIGSACSSTAETSGAAGTE